jgi:hypothetical protein
MLLMIVLAKPWHMFKKCLLFVLLCGWQGMLVANQWRLSGADDSASNPDQTTGAMISYLHEPTAWQWAATRPWLNRLQLGLGASVATWHSDSPNIRSAKAKKDLHTFAINPTIIATLYQGKQIQPYAIGSIGPAYLSTTQFASQHLGGHVNFQDLAGLGARFGSHWDASINYLHYSNASLASHNQGVDIHWMASIAYHTNN